VPKMFPVDSSAIARIGYDVEAKEAYVEFRESGGIYAYSGVPLEVFAELARADSKGTFVNEVIKRYPFRQLDGRA
jgi:hypothetical protein